MTILLISHGIPYSDDPQWGCFELDQARALESIGHKVILAAIDGRFRKVRSNRGILYSELGKLHSYLYYLFPLRLLVFPFMRMKVRSLMMWRLFNLISKKEGKPDLIYAHYLFSMSSLDLVHKANPGIPIVGIEHWSHLSGEKLSNMDRKRGELGYNIVDRLLAVSPSLQAQIMNHFRKDSEVVFDTVDSIFLDSPIKADKLTAPFRFVSIGTLNEGKGFDILIKAFSQMSLRQSELTIIGDGPLHKTLVKLCRDLGTEKRVLLKGILPHGDIVDTLSRSNAYVLASKSETFGVSYLEAMAMGLPAIATRCGGPESFMNDSCGVLVDVDDIDGLSVAMEWMIEHVGDYDPLAIREYVRSRFSGEVIAKQLESIFVEEINKKQQ